MFLTLLLSENSVRTANAVAYDRLEIIVRRIKVAATLPVCSKLWQDSIRQSEFAALYSF